MAGLLLASILFKSTGGKRAAQEDELSCFHPIEVWKAIDLFIRIKEKEEAARESGSTTLSQSRLKKLAAFQMPAPLPLKILDS